MQYLTGECSMGETDNEDEHWTEVWWDQARSLLPPPGDDMVPATLIHDTLTTEDSGPPEDAEADSRANTQAWLEQ